MTTFISLITKKNITDIKVTNKSLKSRNMGDYLYILHPSNDDCSGLYIFPIV